MDAGLDRLRRALENAHAEALRVHDSPVRADRLYATIQSMAADLPGDSLGDERTARMAGSLADALRVLRRDEDGREAAKHLQAALRLLESRPRAPNPFLDD